MIEVKDIKNLLKMFEGDDIDEVEIHSGESRIRLSLGAESSPEGGASDDKKPLKDAKEEGGTAEIQASDGSSVQAAESSSIYELKSNWVGFFTRLNPKKGENYIKLRDVVKKGAIVGHVRVLGVLQDLVSEEDGKVKEILVEEGQPIEYGQPLMRLEK